MIKKFTIYGERCSGTNFLMHAILANFNIEFTSKYSWKHFFGNYNFENNEEEDETLFIGIVRNPIEWIDSFYRKMHHIPYENRLNINTFLFNTFYSIYEDSKTEIIEDRHIITKERYKNIFELRYIKNDFLINTMKGKVKNYILIRYEDLRDNYNNILNFLCNRFNLMKKYDVYVKITNYKGIKNYAYEKKEIKLRRHAIKNIINNINIEQERSICYLLNKN